MHNVFREVHSDDERGMVTPKSKVKKEKEKVVQLEPVFFKVGDTLDEDEINQFRMKYREFRTGKAFGAHGEIEKPRVLISDSVDTVVPPFIAKLASMLKNSMYAEYVGWSEDGKTVSVKKVSEFSSAILPKYFKHNNFTSFLRQLNMYGFHTARQGQNWREFRNDLFTRDKPALYTKIKRKANLLALTSKTQPKPAAVTNPAPAPKTDAKGKKRKKAGKPGDSPAGDDSEQVQSLTAELRKSNLKVAKLEKKLGTFEKVLKQMQLDLQTALTANKSFSQDNSSYQGKSSSKSNKGNSYAGNSSVPMMRNMSNMSEESNQSGMRFLRYNSSSGTYVHPSFMNQDDEDYFSKDEAEFNDTFSFSPN